ncbi:MAG TPA: hypothetical protein DEB39_12035 [Planctomycetaceae bacterium]|nr:hypothetical protein [Planctomycetaceae bacterium]
MICEQMLNVAATKEAARYCDRAARRCGRTDESTFIPGSIKFPEADFRGACPPGTTLPDGRQTVNRRLDGKRNRIR